MRNISSTLAKKFMIAGVICAGFYLLYFFISPSRPTLTTAALLGASLTFLAGLVIPVHWSFKWQNAFMIPFILVAASYVPPHDASFVVIVSVVGSWISLWLHCSYKNIPYMPGQKKLPTTLSILFIFPFAAFLCYIGFVFFTQVLPYMDAGKPVDMETSYRQITRQEDTAETLWRANYNDLKKLLPEEEFALLERTNWRYRADIQRRYVDQALKKAENEKENLLTTRELAARIAARNNQIHDVNELTEHPAETLTLTPSVAPDSDISEADCSAYNARRRYHPASSDELFEENLTDLQGILTPQEINALKQFKGFALVSARRIKLKTFISSAKLRLQKKYQITQNTPPAYPAQYERELGRIKKAEQNIRLRRVCNNRLAQLNPKDTPLNQVAPLSSPAKRTAL